MTKRAKKSSAACKGWVLSLRLNMAERQDLAAEADSRGVTLSEIARELLFTNLEELKTAQGHLPFADVEADDDDGQGAKEELSEFLDAVSQSARGLAKGWVKMKLLPKLERARKNTQKSKMVCADCGKPITDHGVQQTHCTGCALDRLDKDDCPF